MTKSIQQLFDLRGRTAIVTGGGTHLGTAFTEALCDLGAKVYIASRRYELCEEVADRLRGQGMDTTAIRCDVTDESQVDALVDRVMNENDRLDIAICNAGGSFTTSYPPNGDVDEFRQTLDVNLTGTYITAQSAGRAMIPAKCGSIITLGSIAATLAMDSRIYNPEFKRSGPPYIAAKGGILSLTLAMAAEFGEGSDVIVWSISDTMITLGCQYSGCRFHYSYSFVESEDDEVAEITLGKNYFKSHSIQAHLNGVRKSELQRRKA